MVNMAKDKDSDIDEMEELRRQIGCESCGTSKANSPATPPVKSDKQEVATVKTSNDILDVTKNWAPFASLCWASWHRGCEKEVVRCVQQEPLIKTILEAMEKKGCEFDLMRHVVCENCDHPGWLKRNYGSYDSSLNQICLCGNQVKKKQIRHVFLRELIVAYDHCRVKMDATNIKHQACTQVRAANLSGECTSLRKMWKTYPLTTLGRVNDMHKECVRKKAVDALQKSFSHKPRVELRAAVDAVLDKCYNDLEPIGRQPRRGSAADGNNAYIDSQFLNYSH